MEVAQKKAKQIKYYYLFHKKIYNIFNYGLNPFYKNPEKTLINIILAKDINVLEYFYILDINWINSWKKYSQYNSAILNLNDIKENLDDEEKFKKEIKERCDNMILTGEINNSEKFKPSQIKYNSSGKIFIHKIYYNLEDFDCLVDEKTFDLFQEFSGPQKNKPFYIRGIISDKMISLLIEDERKMKFIFHGGKNDNINLLQLTADFNKTKNIKPFNTIGIFTDYPLLKFDTFKNKIIFNKKAEELINYFINLGIEKKNNIDILTETKAIYYTLYNDNLYKKEDNNREIKKNNHLDNASIAKFVGLENVGATCYMNATLQCLINIDILTRYLLKEKNYNNIKKNNINLYNLTSCYCEVLYHVCCDENIKSYKPTNFKNIISRKNPLFQGIQANDSKDLINFLLEEMHNELKNLENNDNNFVDSITIDQTNKYKILDYFKKTTQKQNKSIISKVFYVLIETETKCQACNIQKYNYQVSFYFEFPLEKIYNFCSINNNMPLINNKNRKCIPLLACFEDYRQMQLFTGENKFYCNICRDLRDAMYVNNIYSLPPILILVLNRGKGNIFTCDVDFPQNLNLQNFVHCPKSNTKYLLKGVITHFGESGMSELFIAYCRHRISNKWYCYNDSVVTLCQDQENDFKNGTPYILFYESENGKDNFLFDENISDLNNNNCNQINQICNNINNNNLMNGSNSFNNMNMNNIGMNFNYNNMNNGNLFVMNDDSKNISMNNNNYMNNMNNMNNINNINNMNNMNLMNNMNYLNNINIMYNMNNLNNM